MIQQQTLTDYAVPVPAFNNSDSAVSGYFAAIRLDDFSQEHVNATAVYSRKDFYKISLITGHATYHYRDQAYLLEPGDCALVFTSREVPYRWEIHNGTCSGYACMFTDDFLPLHTYQRPSDWHVFNDAGSAVYKLNGEQQEAYTAIFKKMLDEQTSAFPNKYDLLFVYVLECILGALKLETERESRPETAGTRLTSAFKALLSGQFPLVTPQQEITLRTPQAFADKLAVHVNSLNRVLKEETGKTTTQLITERVMQEARALLIYSNWTVSQISDSLGFDEPTHFTKAFRKFTGTTPTALRHVV